MPSGPKVYKRFVFSLVEQFCCSKLSLDKPLCRKSAKYNNFQPVQLMTRKLFKNYLANIIYIVSIVSIVYKKSLQKNFST